MTLYRAVRAVVAPILRLVWRLEVVGAENMPAGPAIVVANHDSLLQFPDTEDRRLSGMEDDRRGKQAARHAMIGDGETAARNIGGGEIAGPGPRGQVVELAADFLKAQRAGVLDDRNDQSLVAQGGPDSDVDAWRNGDAILFPSSVDRGGDGHRP